jgi:RNA polymerase sigma factor (sigma-70 family)
MIKEERQLTLEEFYQLKVTFPDRPTAAANAECNALAWLVVEQNLPLIYWVLQRKAVYRVPSDFFQYDDAASSLKEALYDAVWNHEPSLGAFSSYAVSCLRGKLSTFQIKSIIHAGPFSAPNNKPIPSQEILDALDKDIEDETYQYPDAISLAGKRIAAYERHIAAQQGQYTRVRMVPLRDEDNFIYERVPAVDLIVDETTEDGHFADDLAEIDPIGIQNLYEALATLTDREQKVLELRYGLNYGAASNGQVPMKLEEIGREFNVSRERIRQIEMKALRKMRHPMRSRKLRGLIDINAAAKRSTEFAEEQRVAAFRERYEREQERSTAHQAAHNNRIERELDLPKLKRRL